MEATASYLLMLQKCISSKQKTQFTINNMNEIGLKEIFSNPIYANNILDVNKYLMKRTWYTILFDLIKKISIRLLFGR